MSMHLCPIYVTTTAYGRKKKPKSAKQIQAEREHDEHLAKLVKKHGINLNAGKNKPKKVFTGVEPRSHQRETVQYPSEDSGTWTAAKKETMHYTGDKLLGIATMHKSNMVPVFSKQEAEDISKMRRG